MQDELDEAGLDSSSVLFTQHEVASLLDTSAFHSPVSRAGAQAALAAPSPGEADFCGAVQGRLCRVA